MKRNGILLIILFFIAVLFWNADYTGSQKLFAKDRKPERAKSKSDGPVYLVLNAGDRDDAKFFKDWLDPVEETDLNKWCKSVGVSLEGDRGPISDGRARFVSRFGSKLLITGLNRNYSYRMWIDFVSFRGAKNTNIPARLEISIDGRLLKTLNFGEITRENNPLMMEIPYDLTQDGAIDIVFNEHSMSGGFWGVYDIIISNRESLPEKLVPAEENIKDKTGKQKKRADEIKTGKKPEAENKAKDRKRLKDKDSSARKPLSKKPADTETEVKTPGNAQGKDKDAQAEAQKVIPPKDTVDIKKPDDPGLTDKKQPEIKSIPQEPAVTDVKAKDK